MAPRRVGIARSSASGGAAAALVLALAGCAAGGWRDEVRRQASHDLRCPVREVRIVVDDGETRGRRVTLEVCGRRRVYREVATLQRRGDRPALGPRWRPVKRRRHRATAQAEDRARPAARRSGERSRAGKAAPSPSTRRSRRGGATYGATVHRVVASAMASACVAARRRMTAPGVLVVHFSIGPRGRVTDAFPEVEDVPAQVSSCVVNRIRDLRFPSPPGGRATFHSPFQLEPPR
jgi:hypothetical protein